MFVPFQLIFSKDVQLLITIFSLMGLLVSFQNFNPTSLLALQRARKQMYVAYASFLESGGFQYIFDTCV